MGLLNAILGNASEINVEELEKEFQGVLGEGEEISKAFVLVRDLIVFTNKRLILVDKQGLTGKKKEYHSIPYRSVTHFTIQSKGHLDLESEMTLWLLGEAKPLQFTFYRDTSVLEIQRTLASHL
jgi:hypothetical protein